MTDYKKLDAYLETNLDRSLAVLGRLVAQPSISAQKIGLHECAVLVPVRQRPYPTKRDCPPFDCAVAGHSNRDHLPVFQRAVAGYYTSLSLAGGALGIALGIGIALLVDKSGMTHAIIAPDAILLAVSMGFSVVTIWYAWNWS